MPLMVLFLFFFFVAIGSATIIEAWYGTLVAQKWVYQANWFSLILFYLFVSLIYNMVKFKMYRLKKLSTFLFHLSFLIIVIGAVLTRYLGFEGVMHIREGETSNQIVSQETYLQVLAHDNNMQYIADVPVMIDTNSIAYIEPYNAAANPLRWFDLTFDHNNYFEHSFDFHDRSFTISCVDIMKNPKDTLVIDPKGDAYLEIVTSGKQYQFLKSGETKAFDSGLKLAFNNEDYTDAIKIYESDTGLYIQSPFDINWLEMATMKEGVIKRDSLQEFWQKRLYVVGNEQFMFNRYFLGGRIETMESEEDMKGLVGVTVKIESGEEEKTIMLKGGRGLVAKSEFFEFGGLNWKLGFGSIIREVPFALALRDFQLERYPGSPNPASFASDVTLLDPANGVSEDKRIYMNNVLDYGGYRFFQSSYDPDEGGTILSVNKDRPGTICTYIGYFLLGLGFFINLFAPGSRFRMLMKKSAELRAKRGATMIVLLLMLGGNIYAQEEANVDMELPVVDEAHAEKFSHLLVQHIDRYKPVHTLANEILRKVSRQTSYEGQNATQVFIGMHTVPFAWLQEPIIYVSGKPLQEKFHVQDNRAALLDFFSPDFEYLLYEDAEKARRKRPAERSQYDKDVLKTDERFNILNGVFNGYYLKLFPKPADSANMWYSPYDTYEWAHDDSVLVSGMMKLYVGGVQEGIQTGDWTNADKVVELISAYQRKTSPAEILPSESKINLEIWYNNANLFKRLMYGYLTFGFILLLINFVGIFAPKMSMKTPNRIGFWIFALMWLTHGVGLGIRWYLSGHAPWSNGYEAVVFIAFVTVLAGLLFARNSKIVIGATGILAWLMLFVAHMNQMDPEITQLVPVLQSYWLMIHVAIITGSYGFLGLGAILGLIILVMNLFLTESNRKRLFNNTKELTYISEMTITVGLFMLTIGTFLGGVWANESWGRYWGWDAKETWALASVLIYAVVIHLRFIPRLKSQFAFNAFSLWAYGSIIMTFFGVNFYLSGLHSYAQGDPMPIPNWVPITVWLLAALTIISGLRVNRAKKWSKEVAQSKDDTH